MQFTLLEITFSHWNIKSFRYQVTLGIFGVSQEEKIILQSFMNMNDQ